VITAISLFTAISLLATVSLPTRSLSKSVYRNFNTQNEEHALIAAETADYTTLNTSIVGTKRFNGDPSSFSQSSYIWANFIDIEVVDYYQSRYDYQQKQIFRPRSVTFTYHANATYIEQLHIFNTTQQEQGTKFSSSDDGVMRGEPTIWNVTAIAFYDSDKSAPLVTIRPFEYMFYRNQSEYYELPKNFDLNFSNCYLVEMELEYSQTSGPVTAFWSTVHQIVVLDQNLVPVWIGITASQAIA
jgi:hypothetical protein